MGHFGKRKIFAFLQGCWGGFCIFFFGLWTLPNVWKRSKLRPSRGGLGSSQRRARKIGFHSSLGGLGLVWVGIGNCGGTRGIFFASILERIFYSGACFCNRIRASRPRTGRCTCSSLPCMGNCRRLRSNPGPSGTVRSKGWPKLSKEVMLSRIVQQCSSSETVIRSRLPNFPKTFYWPLPTKIGFETLTRLFC